jgi:hypothetical protein
MVIQDPTMRLEPMTVGQILDHAFRLYRSRFLPFVATVAVVYVPLSLLSLVGTSLMYSDMGLLGDVQFSGPTGTGFAIGLGVLATTGLMALIGYQLANAALFKSVSAAYLEEDVGVGEAYRSILGHVPSLLGATLLISIILLVGYLLFVVPGVIWQLMFALTMPSIVLERCTARAGMERSRELARGNLGKIFGVFLGVSLVTIILSVLFELPGQLLIQFFRGEHGVAVLVFGTMSSMVGSLVATPVSAAATILLYYDLRIRKEGFDLEILARGIGVPLPPPAVPSSLQP